MKNVFLTAFAFLTLGLSACSGDAATTEEKPAEAAPAVEATPAATEAPAAVETVVVPADETQAGVAPAADAAATDKK